MMHAIRRLASAVVAIFVALNSLLVCAPGVIAAAPDGHCKPAQTVEPACSHDVQQPVMDCCATSAPEPAPLPQESTQQAARTIVTSLSAIHADVAAIAAALELPALARLLRDAPPHGYRSTDLPTLHAVFLI